MTACIKWHLVSRGNRFNLIIVHLVLNQANLHGSEAAIQEWCKTGHMSAIHKSDAKRKAKRRRIDRMKLSEEVDSLFGVASQVIKYRTISLKNREAVIFKISSVAGQQVYAIEVWIIVIKGP